MVNNVTIVVPYDTTYVIHKRNPKDIAITLCTHIRKGKDYPYNSVKRGWNNEGI